MRDYIRYDVEVDEEEIFEKGKGQNAKNIR